MEEKRDEIYERIPWESLEKPNGDRQWLILGIAAAIVAGALGYSFMSSRGAIAPQPTLVTAPVAAVGDPDLPAPQPVTPTPAAPTTTLPPVVAQADLYAVPPGSLADSAAAHAEIFVAEFLTITGSEDDQNTLRTMLPPDLPLPSAPEGGVVFVEWVGAVSATEIGTELYEVQVVARYMVAADGSTYQRVEPELVTVRVAVDDSGTRVVSAPSFSPLPPMAPTPTGIVDLPPELGASVAELSPGSEILGGVQRLDGTWEAVVMSTTVEGLNRPETILIGP
jgi:hypothetical protein